MDFYNRLITTANTNNSWLCIGLDPEPDKIPTGMSVLDFCRSVIEATQDLVCAYKPNAAFFEALGSNGLGDLKAVIKAVPDSIPVILDAKRGDIGNTARAYARAAFDELGSDAVTVNPYLGYDSIEPFIAYHDKGVFILCRTSNPGAADFQSLDCNGKPLYRLVADRVADWNIHHNLGLVVGATQPKELKTIRQEHPTIPFLIPGIGAQGGNLEQAVKNGSDQNGRMAIISSSRQIIYASSNKDYAMAVRRTAQSTRDEINRYR